MQLFKFCPIKRLMNGFIPQPKQISTGGFPLQFMISPKLWAEPLKAKKKIDPAIIKAREEKKKRRMEKMIRKRLKFERQLKPVYENEVPHSLVVNLSKRERKTNVSLEVVNERIKLLKQWCLAKNKEGKEDIMLVNRLMASQEVALRELRDESEELYQAAVKIDSKLIPLDYSGPAETPSLKEYFIPDGEYIDISKKWI